MSKAAAPGLFRETTNSLADKASKSAPVVSPKTSPHVRVTTLLRCGAILTLAAVLLPGTLNAQTFIRGDFNGSGSVDVADAVATMSYSFLNGPGPSSSCGGAAILDSADANDNEYLTIADPMFSLATLFFGETMPAPNSCGTDPSNDTAGFDTVDGDYRVSLLSGVATPANGSGRSVSYSLYVDSPEDVIGMELYFAIDPALLSNPSFGGNSGLVLQGLLFNVVVLRLADPGTPLAVAAGTNYLGDLTFDLANDVEVPTLEFVPDLVSTFQRRATLVTADFRDHHPAFVTHDSAYFQRGDVNGDGLVNTADIVRWLEHYYLDAPLTNSPCGPFVGEAMDINDNEFITPADLLALRSTLFCGGAPIPAPVGDCGPDPSNSTAGFEAIDPNYRLVISDIVLIGAGPAERELILTVQVQTPLDMNGFQILLQLNDPDLFLDSPFFVPTIAFTDTVLSDGRQQGDQVSVLAAQGCGVWISGNPGVLQTVGTLHFTLLDNELEGPIDFIDEVGIGLFRHHNSIIDIDSADHRPVTEAGVFEFRRGYLTNDDIFGLADILFYLNFLFQSGAAPGCLDAADLNNDGVLTLLDALQGLNYLFLMGPRLPDPFTSCGRDNDIDELECNVQPLVCN